MSPARYKRSPKADRTLNGVVFDSKREMGDAIKLQALERSGNISDLKYQVRFVLIPKSPGVRETCYVADFTWVEDGKLVIADSKGDRTEIFILKKKLMKYLLGLEITEI